MDTLQVGTQAAKALSSDRHLAATIGKNTAFGVISSAAQVITRLVMVPIVIFHLGLGGYGIWSIVMATAGYMRFGSAGVKSAFQKYVAEATGSGDYETTNKLLSTGSILMLGISIIGLIPLGLYSRTLAKASGVPPQFLAAAAGSITLLAVIMVVSNFGSVFEAIVMGGHRIDLTRSFNVVSIVGEAIAIITLLHFGYGIFAMAVTMAVSELLYIFWCFLASRRVVPEIRIRCRYFTRAVFRELIRFAGSYQLVNMLEVLYLLLLPVTMLKYFGAEIAGVYAVAIKVVAAALIAQDALILPLLSGGTLVFASGSRTKINRFFRKAFKVTLAVTLLPLAFVATFGAFLVLAWTGQSGGDFQIAVRLTCLAGLFQSISRLQLILYRASGRALHDNVRQAFRLVVLALVAAFGGLLGFYGVLAVLAGTELIGVIYMFFAMTSALDFFNPRDLVPDTMKLIAATTLTLIAGVAVTLIPAPAGINERTLALIRLGEISLACLVACWPSFASMKSMSMEEQRAIIVLLTPWRKVTPVLVNE